jgi:hypothetical protein
VAPLEPWEKVLITGQGFLDSTHGKLECEACHAGVQSSDKLTAHTGLVARPSSSPQDICGACHVEITTTYQKSLHSTQDGYWTVLNARSTPENHPALNEMFGNHCAGCHTTCGDCHISQPHHVGGGFLNGHLFEKTPPMTRTCTACHGSRVGNEYLGKHEDLPGDVHFRKARMNCVSCHSGQELHMPARGLNGEDTHRYAGAQSPSCETCHIDIGAAVDPNEMHQMHTGDLSCQVCHSITYTSCDGCHVAISDKTGNPYYRTESTYFTFLIGRNTRQSPERPYAYVPVRHVPAARDAYSFYGENLLPNFDNWPTWAYATPHNIQLKTPQTASCSACHGNEAIFLTADKVAPDELAANQPVIVQSVPLPLEDLLNAPGVPADHLGRTVCNACHTTGAGGAPPNPDDHMGRQDSSCMSCHKLPAEGE